ncbi:ankyrin repeat domain-containing protein [Candidatus Babeliales bacterium]|nr:ankyrin repeat domain-containing protein [Candidatus Babeliales bacterium]
MFVCLFVCLLSAGLAHGAAPIMDPAISDAIYKNNNVALQAALVGGYKFTGQEEFYFDSNEKFVAGHEPAAFKRKEEFNIWSHMKPKLLHYVAQKSSMDLFKIVFGNLVNADVLKTADTGGPDIITYASGERDKIHWLGTTFKDFFKTYKSHGGRNILHYVAAFDLAHDAITRVLTKFFGDTGQECVDIVDFKNFVNQADNQGIRPIVVAVQKNTVYTIHKFLAEGAEVEFKVKGYDDLAEKPDGPCNFMQALGGLVVSKSAEYNAASFYAILASRYLLFWYLKFDGQLGISFENVLKDLELQKKINEVDYNGQTLLMKFAMDATRQDRLEFVLKVPGIDIEKGNPLHIAAEAGWAFGCKTLLTAGAKVDAVDSDGNTALHVAARAGKSQVCIELVSKGADVNAVNNVGNTPLHCVFLRNPGSAGDAVQQVDIVDYLIAQGAKKIKNKAGDDQEALLSKGSFAAHFKHHMKGGADADGSGAFQALKDKLHALAPGVGVSAGGGGTGGGGGAGAKTPLKQLKQSLKALKAKLATLAGKLAGL